MEDDDIDDYIDYEVGDWVETCHIMPGIVQVIDKEDDTVQVFYPHYKEQYPDYTGGSCCSIRHCGVHKIDAELAEAFFKVGEERTSKVYEFLQRNVHIKSLATSIKWWSERKEEYGNNSFGDEKYYNTIIEDCENQLCSAWENFHTLYHQTIKDLANGVINDTTKGIWLSYKKHTIKKMKNGFRLIELVETGERFLIKKQRRKFHFIEKID